MLMEFFLLLGVGVSFNILGAWVLWVGYFGVLVLVMIFSLNFSFSEFHYFGGVLGGDFLGLGLSVLSIWVMGLMIFMSLGYVNKEGGFMVILGVLLAMLLGVFLSVDLMMFYYFFEGALIPVFLLILGWGYQPERLQAGVYLLFYTLFASLPLLLVLLVISISSGSLTIVDFFELGEIEFSLICCGGGLMAFLVKMPSFILHLWLPKAHVEAPLAGSMVLAGVLLKMGGYGILRFIGVFYKNLWVVGSLWVGVGVVGMVFLGLVCLCQSDLKALVAYSSVVHMGLVLGGLVSMSEVGVSGAYILMVGHGLCSSGLFCLVNMNYLRFKSRSVLVNSGLVNILPSSGLIWFLLCSANMAAPPSINLLGEISLIGSMIGWSKFSLMGLMGGSFLGGAYCLYLFSIVQHGGLGVEKKKGGEITVLEYLGVFLHWVPLNILILSVEVLG